MSGKKRHSQWAGPPVSAIPGNLGVLFVVALRQDSDFKSKTNMGTAGVERSREDSQVFTARLAGIFYLLTFLTGVPAFLIHGRFSVVCGALAGVCYVAVTVLFYFLFRPVSRWLSLIAMLVSLAACAIGPLAQLGLVRITFDPLVLFGVYCLLIGYLISRSMFLPGILGMLMAFAGLGWLTFASARLASLLSPYNILPGIIGEGSLTVWLLLKGVGTTYRDANAAGHT